jgi:hypothetical protein
MLQFSKTRLRREARKHRLNDRYVRDLKPEADGAYLVWDVVQYGLAIQVQPTGYRAFKLIYACRGRSRWLHIANANAIDVEDARRLARIEMVKVAEGKDPAADRKASRHSGMSFEQLAAQYAKYAARINKSWLGTTS